jgi:Uma2 family endonuclease
MIMGMIVHEIMKDETFRAKPELPIVIDGDEQIPDISVYKREKANYGKKKDTVRVEDLPLLAIEILSPTQTIDSLYDKAETYLRAGVKSVWIVQPMAHTVTVMTDITESGVRFAHQGILEDITGVRADLGIIFED